MMLPKMILYSLTEVVIRLITPRSYQLTVT